MSIEFIYPNSPESPLDLENQIDLVCDEFERQWRSGNRPELREFLNKVNQKEQSALFLELLLVDQEFRAEVSDVLDRDTYLKEFPDFSQEIEKAEILHQVDDTASNSAQTTLQEPAYKGKVIGHFRLLEKLGTGAAGEVWKATDLRLQRSVAIKFPRHTEFSENHLLRFQREGKAAAQLTHEGIVPVLSVDRDGNIAYIISEYIEGQNLRSWLSSERPSAAQTAEFGCQLADALHHAHQHGVIHRDLKPANILIDGDGALHITDFGLAKWNADESEMTLDGDLLGTPAYMAPEQARGEAALSDQRTDIYSLGVVLYEMLTGKCPFLGENTRILHQVIHESPRPPRTIKASIPKDLETICIKALEKRPGDRYPSAQEMAVDLRRFLRGDAIFARPISPWERTMRWMRKRPAVVAAGAFGLIALFCMAIVLYYAQQNRILLGFRPVQVTTEPAGAEVTFVPINEATGEPILEKIVKAENRTPIQIDLQPGSYLTVVVLENGLFHEVLRRVPAKNQDHPGAFNHNKWDIDDHGNIILPSIKIPDQGIEEGMAKIEGRKQDVFRNEQVESGAIISGQIPGFYIDCTEVSLREIQRLTEQGNTDGRWNPVPPSWAITVNYDDALRHAENMGKRLPTQLELAHVIATGIAGRLDEPSERVENLDSVGTPESDRLEFNLPVFGLRSNVAEWTSSLPTLHSPNNKAPQPQLSLPFMREHRIVCCGSQDALSRKGLNVVTEQPVPMSVPIGRVSSGLGFRCVRSIRPRVSPEDFGNAILKRQTLPVKVE